MVEKKKACDLRKKCGIKFTKREKEILVEVINILVERLSPQKIYLFGSRAKNEADVGADFDLAVESIIPNSVAKALIKEKIDSVSGLYSVDVVNLSEVDDDFQKIIMQTGVLVYEKRRGCLLN